MRHCYDVKGVCFLCGKRWFETIGTQCLGWIQDESR